MSSPNSPGPSASPASPEDPTATDLPLPLAASTLLTHLPKPTQTALHTAGELLDDQGRPRLKVKVRLQPLPSMKAITPPVVYCGTGQRFDYVVRFLRKKLQIKDAEGVYCYVNKVFAPGLEEGVGNLWRCFKTGDELVVSYSVTQAFG